MFSMTAWLDPLREALDESDRHIDFFFRDDDVGWANDEFRALLACFRRHSVPIDIAAIPSALTVEFAAEICALHDEAPALVGIHQHGFHTLTMKFSAGSVSSESRERNRSNIATFNSAK